MAPDCGADQFLGRYLVLFLHQAVCQLHGQAVDTSLNITAPTSPLQVRCKVHMWLAPSSEFACAGVKTCTPILPKILCADAGAAGDQPSCSRTATAPVVSFQAAGQKLRWPLAQVAAEALMQRLHRLMSAWQYHSSRHSSMAAWQKNSRPLAARQTHSRPSRLPSQSPALLLVYWPAAGPVFGEYLQGQQLQWLQLLPEEQTQQCQRFKACWCL